MTIVTYRRGIYNRLLKYALYLLNPTDGQSKFQTSLSRAYLKFSDIFNYIETELDKPNVTLYRCFYKKFRGGNQNRKMLKYFDRSTPKTVWLISVKKNKDCSWKVFGIEQEKVLASMDEKILDDYNKTASLKEYIIEQKYNTHNMKSLRQFIKESRITPSKKNIKDYKEFVKSVKDNADDIEALKGQFGTCDLNADKPFVELDFGTIIGYAHKENNKWVPETKVRLFNDEQDEELGEYDMKNV